MRCAWQVEIDEYCRRVLAKHWPDVRRWDDVRTFPPDETWERPFAVCAGFPCQPTSLAGRGLAQADERWLWPEVARVIDVFRPPVVVLENPPGLLVRGATDVFGDLAARGFDAEWTCIPAAALGAPHPRWRVLVVAYRGPGSVAIHSDAADANCDGKQQSKRRIENVRRRTCDSNLQDAPHATSRFAGQRWRNEFSAYCQSQRDVFWPDAQPGICGVAPRVPHRLDRLRGLGNAVVPQVAEWIGRRIIEAEQL